MSYSAVCDMRTVYVCTPIVPPRTNLRASRCTVQLVRDALDHVALSAVSATSSRARKFLFAVDDNPTQVVAETVDPADPDASTRGTVAVRLESGTIVHIFLDNPEDPRALHRLLTALRALSSDDSIRPDDMGL